MEVNIVSLLIGLGLGALITYLVMTHNNKGKQKWET